MKSMYTAAILLAIFACSIFSQQDGSLSLPKPRVESGKPLMQCLNQRQTSRSFSAKPLELQELSDLLWAACGINRPESGKRTAPSAMNNQETDIYVSMQKGVYLYNPKTHSLDLVLKEDIRGLTGKQDFVKSAPVNLVYVADFSKMGKSSEEDKLLYGGADVGFIAENVYLYCASRDLAVVVRGSVDKQALSTKLGLKASQRIILTQTVGYKQE